MNPNPIRVLVVDDSAFARKVIRESLSRSPDLDVVGIARDGLEALEKIAELKPDVITLDLIMPNLDGLGVLRALADIPRPPRVIVVSISDGESELVVQALQLGAVDLVHKPTALATDRLYELSAELVEKVLAAAHSQVRDLREAQDARKVGLPAIAAASRRLVVVGTSTGGPQALTRLINALPGTLPCAMAVALHIPAGYTQALAQRLDESAAVKVFEAFDDAELGPGSVAMARGGSHLRVRARSSSIILQVGAEPAKSLFCPSVDVLFESAAAAFGPAVLGVVLTGMGSDGLQGARAIREAGGAVLTESKDSCVVYGMPRAVSEAGLSNGEAAIEDMAAAIVEHL